MEDIRDYGEEMEEVSMETCESCGEEFDCDDMKEVNGYHYCESCYDEEFTVCDECGDVVSREDSLWHDNTCMCESCYDDKVVLCGHRRCGETLWQRDAIEINGVYYCRNCASEYFVQCSDCGDWLSRDDSYYHERTGNNYCSSCYPGDSSCEKIHDYGYKPTSNFLKTADDSKLPKPRLYFGVELEVENCRDNAADFVEEYSNNENKFYLKNDGSLDEGFEIVTHPATFDYHMNRMNWDSMCDYLKSHGGKSHDTSTCGLHVHLSRNFFTASEVTRLVAFVNIQEAFFTALARRSGAQWSKFKNKEKGYSLSEFSKKYNSERYEAVNLQNRDTIELRIFKGSLVADTVEATIQLCNALAHWVKTTSIAHICQSPEESLNLFMGYIHAYSSSYAKLISYLHTRLDRGEGKKAAAIQAIKINRPAAPAVAELPDTGGCTCEICRPDLYRVAEHVAAVNRLSFAILSPVLRATI